MNCRKVLQAAGLVWFCCLLRGDSFYEAVLVVGAGADRCLKSVVTGAVYADTKRGSVEVLQKERQAASRRHGTRKSAAILQNVPPLQATAALPKCITDASERFTAGMVPPLELATPVPLRPPLVGGALPEFTTAGFRWERGTAIAGFLLGVGVEVYRVYRTQWWWEDGIGPWHIGVDNDYAGGGLFVGVDKLAHAAAWNRITRTGRWMWKWTGLDDRNARWAAFLTSALFHGETEGLEGFSRYFRFDPQDYFFGVGIGSFMVALESYVPWFERFTWKMSIWPRGNYTRINSMMNGYDGQKTWLSYNIADGWSLAAGVNLDTYEFGKGNVQLWFSPDFDLRTLDPDSPILDALNFFKLPSPALKFKFHPKFKVEFVLVSWSL